MSSRHGGILAGVLCLALYGTANAAICHAQRSTYGAYLGTASARLGLTAEGERLVREAGFRTESRTGFHAGIWAHLFAARRIGVQPEVHLVQKGVRYRRGPTGLAAGSTTLLIDYMEIPVLVRLHLRDPAVTGLRPFLLAGPAIAFELRCDFTGSSAGVTVSQNCETFNGSSPYKGRDVSAVAGGGLAFRVLRREVTIGLRYTYGMTAISKVGPSIRNTNLSSLLGVAF